MTDLIRFCQILYLFVLNEEYGILYIVISYDRRKKKGGTFYVAAEAAVCC